MWRLDQSYVKKSIVLELQCANKTVQRHLLSSQACFAAHAQKDASSTELNEQQSLDADFYLAKAIKSDLRDSSRTISRLQVIPH